MLRTASLFRFFLLFIAAVFGLAANSFGAAVTTGVNVFGYASTNVTTSAYVTLVASTPYNVSKIVVCDTSTKILKIASGAAASEVDLFSAPVSGCINIPYIIPAGTRLSIKAIDASATTGYNVLTFIP